MNQAGEDTQRAVQNAYLGTVTALRDTAITAEIKAAFVSEMDIKSFDIHVTTTAGVVTLDGHVPNSDMAARVEAIAKNTEGVRDVANNLRISSSSSQN
ncbi:MAG: BON domain-containing protein [Candidatus Binataceae bacterium]|nr:BON domain-containing protein [Candidatus Binataceae bacterium]